MNRDENVCDSNWWSSVGICLNVGQTFVAELVYFQLFFISFFLTSCLKQAQVSIYKKYSMKNEIKRNLVMRMYAILTDGVVLGSVLMQGQSFVARASLFSGLFHFIFFDNLFKTSTSIHKKHSKNGIKRNQ
jgi:hypothetical protein